MVGDESPESEESDGVVATLPTLDTTPGVVWPSGMVIVALSPSLTCDCWAASRPMWTLRAVEVAERIEVPAWAELPRVAESSVTLAPVGRNTAWQRGRMTVRSSHTWVWSFRRARLGLQSNR